MNKRRVLLRCLGWTAVLAVLLVLAEFFPNAQTWTAQLLLARRPDLHASLDRLAAGFGRVEVDNVKLTLGRAVLTLPRLQAHLPVTEALVLRRLAIRNLVARGWTLDLGGAAANAGAGASPVAPGTTPDAVPPKPTSPPVGHTASAARNAVLQVLEALRTEVLPCDLTLNGVDLEGDIVNSPAPDGTTTRLHVVVEGGDLAPGHEGTFRIDISGEAVNAQLVTTSFDVRGRMALDLKTPRTFKRVATDADFSLKGGPFPEGITVSTKGAAALGPKGETCSLDVSRGDRRLVTLHAEVPGAGGRVTGTWGLDLQDTELAAVLPDRTLPRFAATGRGRFDTDPAFSEVHALGRLQASLDRLNVISPALERFGPVNVDAQFDATQRGRTLQVHALKAALTRSGCAATVTAVQAFGVNEATGALRPVEPKRDWLDVSVSNLPRAWLSGTLSGFTFSGGDARGDFLIRTAPGGFSLTTKSAFTIRGASLSRSGRTIGRDLRLSAPLQADWNPHAWNVRAAPVALGDDEGGHFGEMSVKVDRKEGADQPIAVSGDAKLDTAAAAFGKTFANLAPFGGRSAAADFSGTLGAGLELKGQLAVAGRTAGHSLTAGFHVTDDGNGRLSVEAPVRIKMGKRGSDFSVESTLIGAEDPPLLYLKIHGKEADLGQLRLLAAAVCAGDGLPLTPDPAHAATAGARASQPFWGGWNGRVMVELNRLTAGRLNFTDLATMLAVDRKSIRLQEGRGALNGHRFRKVKGTLTFDATAQQAYSLEAAAAFDPIEASTLVGAKTSDGSPVVEGKFSVDATLDGRGADPARLLHRLQWKARLVSTTGIVRVLATNVDEALPKDEDSATGDALSRVGSSFGNFIGIRGSIGPGTRKVSVPIQKAIDVVNQTGEIGYDEFKVTVIREPDGAIRLDDLSVNAGDERASGSGRIAADPGLPLRDRPLHVKLQYGVRRWYAKLMAAADLLSSRKDAHGFTLLKEPVVIGGTLAHPDNRQWHEMLLKSAERKPVKPEKKPEKRH